MPIEIWFVQQFNTQGVKKHYPNQRISVFIKGVVSAVLRGFKTAFLENSRRLTARLTGRLTGALEDGSQTSKELEI